MPANVTLPQIQKSLGVPITGDFIATKLGIEPEVTDRRAKFYTPQQYQKIRLGVIEWLQDREELLDAPDRPASAKKPKPGLVFANDDDF